MRGQEAGGQQNGRTKEDFHSHSHAVVVISPLKQRRPTTLAAGLLVVLVQEEGDLSHKWSPSLHSGTCSGLMRTYLTHFLSGFGDSGAVLFEKWLQPLLSLVVLTVPDAILAAFKLLIFSSYSSETGCATSNIVCAANSVFCGVYCVSGINFLLLNLFKLGESFNSLPDIYLI